MPHTPEDCARRVLLVFQDFNVRADECLMMGSFTNYFVSSPWRMEDFNVGANEAIKLGWARIEKPSGPIFLTALGESELG